jgi:hypothetical protein
MFDATGFVDVSAAGLLVSSSACGTLEVGRAIDADPSRLLVEDALAAHEVLADAGKQLLVTGRRPVSAVGTRA